MSNFHFKAYLGLRFSEYFSNREWNNTVNEIEKLSDYYKITFREKIIVDKVSFSFSNSENDVLEVKNDFSWVTTDNILIIEFQANFERFHENKLPIDYFINKRLQDIVIAISIAKKGGVEIGHGAIVFINGKRQFEFPIFIHNIAACVQKAKEIKWPNIKIVDLEKTINWLNRFQLETDGLSSNKIGRALNAYSFLFDERGGEDNSAELFWALLGIEALYTDNSTGIINQINTKSQLFLGERKEYKKSFGQMYDFRSRFIHGDLNFSNKFILLDNTDEINKHWLSLDENENLAVAILVATFQKLILSNRDSLDFEFKIRRNKKDDKSIEK